MTIKVKKIVKAHGNVYAPKDIVDAKGNLIQKTPTHIDHPNAPTEHAIDAYVPHGEKTLRAAQMEFASALIK